MRSRLNASATLLKCAQRSIKYFLTISDNTTHPSKTHSKPTSLSILTQLLPPQPTLHRRLRRPHLLLPRPIRIRLERTKLHLLAIRPLNKAIVNRQLAALVAPILRPRRVAAAGSTAEFKQFAHVPQCVDGGSAGAILEEGADCRRPSADDGDLLC